jgi:hypothetical protein
MYNVQKQNVCVNISGKMLIWIFFFCFCVWNSCPKFVCTFQLHPVLYRIIGWMMNWKGLAENVCVLVEVRGRNFSGRTKQFHELLQSG